MQTSPDVYGNNELLTRNGDMRYMHCCGNSCHVGSNSGQHNVYINNKSAQAQGDQVSCGSVQVQASSDIFVN